MIKIENTEKAVEFYKDLASLTNSVVKVGYNAKGYGYKYADLGGILEVVKPLLRANNFALVQPLEAEKAGELFLTTMLLHESGNFLHSIVKIEGVSGSKMSNIQALGAGITYMRRYALSSLLAIATDEDTDAAIPRPTPTPTQAPKTGYRPIPKPVKKEAPKSTLEHEKHENEVLEALEENGLKVEKKEEKREEMMTGTQRKKLYATARDKAVEKEEMTAKMQELFKKSSSKELNKKEARTLIKWLENYKKGEK